MRPRSRARAAVAILSVASAIIFPLSGHAANPAPVQTAPTAPPAPVAGPELLSVESNCLNKLSIVGGATPSIASGPGTLSTNGNHLTFRASGHACDSGNETVLTVPARTSIEIHTPSSDNTDYSIADIHGSVDASTGEGTLTIDEASILTLNMAGSGNIHIGRVTERLNVKNNSSGDLSVDTADTSATTLTNMSSGDITISGGSTAILTTRNYSSGDIVLKGSFRDADISVLGSGDVSLGTITRSLTKRVLGSGDLTTADTTGAKITSISTPDKDAVISDVTTNLLDQFNFQKIFQSDRTHTDTSHHDHRGGGNGLIKIAFVVWAVHLFYRYRKTGVVPFHDTAERLARGYAAGMRGWDRHRTSWQDSPVAGASTIARDAWQGFRHATATPQSNATSSVPPGHPLARLQDRLARLEPRIGRLERFVTSSDFGLERQFRELEQAEGTVR